MPIQRRRRLLQDLKSLGVQRKIEQHALAKAFELTLPAVRWPHKPRDKASASLRRELLGPPDIVAWTIPLQITMISKYTRDRMVS